MAKLITLLCLLSVLALIGSCAPPYRPGTGADSLRTSRRLPANYDTTKDLLNYLKYKPTSEKDQLTKLRDRMNSMKNTTVDPCDDFYEYACGGWIEANPKSLLPSAFATANAIFQANMIELVSTITSDPNSAASELHSQCLRDLPEMLSGPIPEVVDLIQGLQNINKDNFMNFVAEFLTLGVDNFFAWNEPKPWFLDASTVYYLPLVPGDANPYQLMPKEMVQHMLQVLIPAMSTYPNILPDGVEPADYVESAFSFWVKLETEFLASMQRFAYYRGNYKKMLADQFIVNVDLDNLKRGTGLEWGKLFELFDVEHANDFVIYDPDYLSNTSYIFLDAIKHSPLEVTAYLTFVFFRDFSFFPLVPVANPDIQKLCTLAYGQVILPLQFPLYTHMFVNQSTTKPIANMLHEIIDKFSSNLQKVAWLDEKTRQAALLKASMFGVNLGGPSLAEYPLPRIPLSTNYYVSAFTTSAALLRDMINRVSTPIDRDDEEWTLSVFGQSPINAFYDPTENGIFIQAPIMLPTFYDPSTPLFAQYAGIGMVLGHEMTHGFDNSGAQFDEYGSYRNWWTEQSLRNFDQHKQCIIDFYSNTSYHTEYNNGSRVNGVITQGENIADFGGLKFSYEAWQDAFNSGKDKYTRKEIESVFQQTVEQLYFISYAQTWCEVPRPAVRDVHSPAPMRILGPLSHFPEFQKAFQCEEGTRYHAPPCEIW